MYQEVIPVWKCLRITETAYSSVFFATGYELSVFDDG